MYIYHILTLFYALARFCMRSCTAFRTLSCHWSHREQQYAHSHYHWRGESVHTATHCNTLQHTATQCNTMHHTAPHCNTLQHSSIHCNTRQHTATHCNTLPCNTLPYITLQHTFNLALPVVTLTGSNGTSSLTVTRLASSRFRHFFFADYNLEILRQLHHARFLPNMCMSNT